MSAIKSIEDGYSKHSSIRSAAKWQGVTQKRVERYIDIYFSPEFFESRMVIPKGAKTKNQSGRQRIMQQIQNERHFRSI